MHSEGKAKEHALRRWKSELPSRAQALWIVDLFVDRGWLAASFATASLGSCVVGLRCAGGRVLPTQRNTTMSQKSAERERVKERKQFVRVEGNTLSNVRPPGAGGDGGSG